MVFEKNSIVKYFLFAELLICALPSAAFLCLGILVIIMTVIGSLNPDNFEHSSSSDAKLWLLQLSVFTTMSGILLAKYVKFSFKIINENLYKYSLIDLVHVILTVLCCVYIYFTFGQRIFMILILPLTFVFIHMNALLFLRTRK